MNTMLRKGLLQRILIVLVSIIIFVFSFEGIWGNITDVPYKITASICFAVILGLVVSKHLYRNADTCLITAFLSFSYISTIINMGVSFSFFTSRFFCAYMIFLGLYYVMQTESDSDRLLRWAVRVSFLGLGVMCLYVLAHASKFLLAEDPWLDLGKGCFVGGRLCGLSNANNMGTACACLIVFSVAGYLGADKWRRWMYIPGIILGWFCMGLTGFRTGMVGTSFSAGLMVWMVMIRVLGRNKHVVQVRDDDLNKYDDLNIDDDLKKDNSYEMDADHKREAIQVRKAGYMKFIIATLMGMLAFVIVIRSFALPVYIYKKSMMIISGILGCEWSKERIAGIMIRHITDDNGTMSDRTLIWAASIRQCTRTLRRFLIGISPLGRDGIIGVYDGRHDIRIVHAHNIYLEILRRTGILGFIPLMSLVICWSINMVRTFLTQKERMYVKWLYVSVFGIFIIGMAEPVVFMHSEWCYSGILVFMISGYLTGKRRLL